MSRDIDRNWGARRHVVCPCDETDEQGNHKRTFDVWRHGKVVHSGFEKRTAAQAEADRLNKEEYEWRQRCSDEQDALEDAWFENRNIPR